MERRQRNKQSKERMPSSENEPMFPENKKKKNENGNLTKLLTN